MRWLLGVLLVLLSAMPALAQPWSGIITPPRAIDWSTAGVAGGIPPRLTLCTTLGTAGQVSTFVQSGVSATTITNALAACTPGQTVKLNPGTYNITGLGLRTNNVTLRGSGASVTILNVSSTAPSGCAIGDGQAVNICSGQAQPGNIASVGVDNSATWNCDDTGGVCAQGRTTITLSGRTGLTVGSTIWLDQFDEADGFPAAGDIWIKNWGGGNTYTRGSVAGTGTNRALLEGHIVASCGTSTPGAACTSNTITITRGLQMPSWRSAQSPGAWWGNTSTVLHDAGIEDLTVDVTGSGTGSNGIYLINCTNCWVKGVRLMYRPLVLQNQGQFRLLNIINGMQVSIVDSYFYGYATQQLVSIYTVSPYIMSQSLVQNNIAHGATNPMVQNSASWGNVWAYNYSDSGGIDQGFSQSSVILHGLSGYQLFEGNAWRNFSGDNIHASHMFTTLFRNHFSGQAHNASGTETQSAPMLYAASRFFNVIGNVIGNSQWSSYEFDCGAPGSGCTQTSTAAIQPFVYSLGWMGSNGTGSGTTGNDANVKRTLMRWGNWNHVTSTNDNATNDQSGTRWCVAPLPSNCGLNPGGGGTQINEMPSGITNYPNVVPASQTLPASFYLSAQPAWWTTPFGTPKWPAVGPDVTSGNVNNGATEPTGGHVDKIPARLCFENLANDPAYPTSSPRVKLFDAATCYLASAPSPPFDFFLSTSGSKTVSPGGSVTNIITAGLIQGADSVVFSSSGLPAGASATYSPTSCSPTCQSTMTIQTDASQTPVGVYTIAVTGTAGAVSQTASFALSVSAIWPPIFIFPAQVNR